MKKTLLALLLLVACAGYAQATTVTATVTDPNSHAYENGTVTATLVPGPGGGQPNVNGTPVTTPVTGSLNGSGAFSITLTATSTIAPPGALWIFRTCSLSGFCFSYGPVTITGSSVSLTTPLSAAAPAIPGTQFVNPGQFFKGDKPFVNYAAAGQTADLVDFYDYTGASLFRLTATGTLTCVSGCGGGGGGAVSSVFGRTGAVTATSGDYTCSLVTSCPTSSTTVIGLFSGCSGVLYLGADGACHSASSTGGTVTSVGTASPLTGGTITTTGTIGCATCATMSGLSSNVIPKVGTSPGTVASSLSDNGTTVATSEAMSASGYTATGSGAGAFVAAQGTAQGHATANQATVEGAAAITSYEYVLPGAAGTGCLYGTDASNVVTGSFGACTLNIASGTAALGTTGITTGTCATVVTVSASGVATTDVIQYTPNGDPTGVTGYAVNASGSLYIWAYPTANNVNFKVCNNTSGTLTPSALTLNWKVVR